MKKTFSKFFWVVCAALVLRACVLEPIRATDDSMAPQVLSGDTVLVSKLRYGLRVPGAGSMLLEWSQPKKGDLVVAVAIGEPPVSLLRRITAVPGEKIRLPDGQESLLQEGYFFLSSEHNENTTDSRQFGPVMRRAIIGKATHIWFPGTQNPSAGEGSKVESGKSRILQKIL